MMVVTMFLFCSIYAQDETMNEQSPCAVSEGIITFDDNGNITIGSELEIDNCLLKITSQEGHNTLNIASKVTVDNDARLIIDGLDVIVSKGAGVTSSEVESDPEVYIMNGSLKGDIYKHFKAYDKEGLIIHHEDIYHYGDRVGDIVSSLETDDLLRILSGKLALQEVKDHVCFDLTVDTTLLYRDHELDTNKGYKFLSDLLGSYTLEAGESTEATIIIDGYTATIDSVYVHDKSIADVNYDGLDVTISAKKEGKTYFVVEGSLSALTRAPGDVERFFAVGEIEAKVTPPPPSYPPEEPEKTPPPEETPTPEEPPYIPDTACK